MGGSEDNRKTAFTKVSSSIPAKDLPGVDCICLPIAPGPLLFCELFEPHRPAQMEDSALFEKCAGWLTLQPQTSLFPLPFPKQFCCLFLCPNPPHSLFLLCQNAWPRGLPSCYAPPPPTLAGAVIFIASHIQSHNRCSGIMSRRHPLCRAYWWLPLLPDFWVLALSLAPAHHLYLSFQNSAVCLRKKKKNYRQGLSSHISSPHHTSGDEIQQRPKGQGQH